MQRYRIVRANGESLCGFEGCLLAFRSKAAARRWLLKGEMVEPVPEGYNGEVVDVCISPVGLSES